MREIEIKGQKFQIRGLRRAEQQKLEHLGYGRFSFQPNIPEELQGAEKQKRLGEIIDAAVLAVMGETGMSDLDRVGGDRAVDKAWDAIMDETYVPDRELKNSSSAGNGSPIPSASHIARPAPEDPTSV